MHSSSSCTSVSSSSVSMKRLRGDVHHRAAMLQQQLQQRAPSQSPQPPTLTPQPRRGAAAVAAVAATAAAPTPPTPTSDAVASFGCFTAAVAPRFFASHSSERGKKESAAAILRALAALQHETEQVPTSSLPLPKPPPPSGRTPSTPSTRSHHPQHRVASATEAMPDVTVSLAPLSAMSAHDSRHIDPSSAAAIAAASAVLRPPLNKRLPVRRGMPTPAVGQRWRRGHRLDWRERSGTSSDIGGPEGSHSGKDFKLVKRQEISPDLMMILEDEMPTQLCHHAYGLESSECSDSVQACDTGSETTEDDLMCCHMHRADMLSEAIPNGMCPVDSTTETTYTSKSPSTQDPIQILMAGVVLGIVMVIMTVLVGSGKSPPPGNESCPGGVCAEGWTKDEVITDDMAHSVKSTPTWGWFSQGDRDRRSSDYPEDIPQYEDEDEDDATLQSTKGRYTHQHPYRYIASILQKKAFGSSRENNSISVTS